MQRKPRAGLRPHPCLCGAEASQKLPGPRGQGQDPHPCSFHCCRGRQGTRCGACLGHSERALVPGAEHGKRLAWLYTARSHPWVLTLVPVPWQSGQHPSWPTRPHLPTSPSVSPPLRPKFHGHRGQELCRERGLPSPCPPVTLAVLHVAPLVTSLSY